MKHRPPARASTPVASMVASLNARLVMRFGVTAETESGGVVVASRACDSPIEALFLAAWKSLMEVDALPGEQRYGAPQETIVCTGGVRRPPLAEIVQQKFNHVLFCDPTFIEEVSGRTFYFHQVDIVIPQAQVEQYRPDFALVRMFQGPSERDDVFLGPVLVECDGADYHDANVHQLQRDRARDRVLQTSGYHVLRFTGKELHADAVACAIQVDDWFQAREDEIVAERVAKARVAYEAREKAGESR